MLSWLTWIFLVRASQSASRRADQCVTPIAASAPGGGVTVADRISAITASVSTLRGPPGRGASASPASPAAAYWARHLTTVGSLHPTRPAICGPVSQSTDSSTIRARSASAARPKCPDGLRARTGPRPRAGFRGTAAPIARAPDRGRRNLLQQGQPGRSRQRARHPARHGQITAPLRPAGARPPARRPRPGRVLMRARRRTAGPVTAPGRRTAPPAAGSRTSGAVMFLRQRACGSSWRRRAGVVRSFG